MTSKEGNKIQVAVKRCRGKQIPLDERLKFMREARIMRSYNHPNIVGLLGIAAQQEPLMILLEYISGGSLLTHLRKFGQGISNSERERFCFDTSKGMDYLESKKCIHRDLAARNCLLTSNKEVKITDFGLSHDEAFYKLRAGRKVPIRWMAPETLSTGNANRSHSLHKWQMSEVSGMYTSKSDRWSFGVLMWEIFSSGKEPYGDMENTDIQKKVVKERYRMPPPTTTPGRIAVLMTDCWQQDPEKRPSFQNLRREFERHANLRRH